MPIVDVLDLHFSALSYTILRWRRRSKVTADAVITAMQVGGSGTEVMVNCSLELVRANDPLKSEKIPE